MKTMLALKSMVRYCQTDDVFIDYIQQLSEAGIIEISDGDMKNNKVSDDFYCRLAAVFGIKLDEKLNPIKQEDE